MQDPFHTTMINPAFQHEMLEDARSAESELPGSVRLAEALPEIHKALTIYRAVRVLCCHIALTTDSTRHAPMPHPSLARAVLSPWNADWRDRSDADTGMPVDGRRNFENHRQQITEDMDIRAFLAAFIEIGELSATDILNPWDTSTPMSTLIATPARAELLTSLSSAWSAINPPAWLQDDLPGIDDPAKSVTTHMTDPGSPDARAVNHFMIMPALMPVDRVAWEPPNKPSHSSRRTWYDYPGIPLLWNWDPCIRPGLFDADMQEDRGNRGNIPPARHRAQQMGYGPSWRHNDRFSLICSAKYGKITGGSDPGTTPLRWVYSLILTPVQDSSPLYTPETRGHDIWDKNMRLTRSRSGGAPFNVTAGIRQSMIRHRALHGPRTSRMSWERGDGTVPTPWWGADAPIAALLSGLDQRHALRTSTTLAMGFNPVIGRKPGSPESPLKADEGLWASLGKEWGDIPDYGPLAALQGGLRYVISSMITGHFAGKGALDPGFHPDAATAPIPTPDLMRLYDTVGTDREATSKKAWLYKKSGRKPTVKVQREKQATHAMLADEKKAREEAEAKGEPAPALKRPVVTANMERSDVATMPRRGRAVPMHTVNLDMWWRDSVSVSDMSLARGLIATGAMSCLAIMLRRIEQGHYGQLVKQWMNQAFSLAEALRHVQYQEGKNLPGAPQPGPDGPAKNMSAFALEFDIMNRAQTRATNAKSALQIAKARGMF